MIYVYIVLQYSLLPFTHSHTHIHTVHLWAALFSMRGNGGSTPSATAARPSTVCYGTHISPEVNILSAVKVDAVFATSIGYSKSQHGKITLGWIKVVSCVVLISISLFGKENQNYKLILIIVYNL